MGTQHKQTEWRLVLTDPQARLIALHLVGAIYSTKQLADTAVEILKQLNITARAAVTYDRVGRPAWYNVESQDECVQNPLGALHG